MILFTLPTDNQIRGNQLADEILQATGVIVFDEGMVFYPPNEVEIDVAEDQASAIQAVVDAHVPDPEYFELDLVKAQIKSGKSDIKQLYTGLSGLSARDASYALVGRAFAYNDGADNQVILGIVDKATAQGYIVGKSEWDNLPIESRQWAADELEVMAILFQGMLAVLR